MDSDASKDDDVEVIVLNKEKNSDSQPEGEPQIIAQLDSSIQKGFEENEEEAGIIPYPRDEPEVPFSVCLCLRYVFCLYEPYTEPPLLGPQTPENRGRKCLILDLDETLVHSSFQRTNLADYQIPLELDEGVPPRKKHFDVFVIKRPGVDKFLEAVGKEYEVVVFTASIERYAHPLLKLLDKNNVIVAQLYREACTEYRGSYVKDLRRLGRDLKDVIIVDNSPAAYQFQPENAIPCSTFIDDMEDKELDYCQEFLLSPEVLKSQDVRDVLDKYQYPGNQNLL